MLAAGGYFGQGWVWRIAVAAFAAISLAVCLAHFHQASVRRSFLAWIEGARYLDDSGVIHQRARNDCGVACIRMTAKMLAQRLDEDGLPVVKSAEGISMADISASLSREGIDNEPWLVALDHLHCVPPTSILHLASQHFVVLESVDSSVIVRDPELGRLRYAAADFRPMWDGKAIVVFAGAQARGRFASCMGR